MFFRFIKFSIIIFIISYSFILFSNVPDTSAETVYCKCYCKDTERGPFFSPAQQDNCDKYCYNTCGIDLCSGEAFTCAKYDLGGDDKPPQTGGGDDKPPQTGGGGIATVFPNPLCPEGTPNCDAGQPTVLIGRIIKAMLGLIGSIALAIFIYGGILWMTSAGNSEMVKKGRDTLMWAAIGLAVIFASYALVKFIFDALDYATK